MTTPKSITRGHLALPHLVRCAKLRRTITYSELGDKIGCHYRACRPFLEYIRDEICAPKDLPFITAIVVRKAGQIPGRGWLPGGTGHLTWPEYTRRYEEVRDDVFACDAWDGLLEEFGLSPIEATKEDLDEEGLAYTSYLERSGQVGEGDRHRILKEYVAQNPRAIGLEPVDSAEQEHQFVCGDRCDVVFDLGEKGHAVVEIKNRERGDLIRGMYQAVKYRALMEAEKGRGEAYPVSAHLVAYDIQDDIAALANRLDIGCHVLPHPLKNA